MPTCLYGVTNSNLLLQMADEFLMPVVGADVTVKHFYNMDILS